MNENLNNLVKYKEEINRALSLADNGLLDNKKIEEIESNIRKNLNSSIGHIDNENILAIIKKINSAWKNVLKPGYYDRKFAEDRFKEYQHLINNIMLHTESKSNLVNKDSDFNVHFNNLNSEDDLYRDKSSNYVLGGSGFGDDSNIDNEQVVKCKEWINKWIIKQSKFNESKSSYSLKHMVEDEVGDYISNGAFIKASIELGYRYKISDKNAFFNMSFVKINNKKKSVEGDYFEIKYTKEGDIKRLGDFVDPVIGVSELSEEISKIIIKMSDNKGAVFGVFGKWGRGKTYLINHIRKNVNIKNYFECVDFHAWKYQNCLSSQAYLYEQILNAYLDSPVSFCFKKNNKYQKVFFEKSNFLIKCIRLFRLARRQYFVLFFFSFLIAALNYFFKYNLSVVVSSIIFFIPAIDLVLRVNTDNYRYFSRSKIRNILGFQVEIEKELKKVLKVWPLKNKRILLIVDDIDRCSENKIIEIVDSLRIILEDSFIHKNVNVLLAADERILERAIKFKYLNFFKERDDFDINNLTSEYLDKLFLCGIRLSSLTKRERSDIVDTFTKNLIIEDDKRFNTDNRIIIKRKKEEKLDFRSKESSKIYKNVNQDQLTNEEVKSIIDAIYEAEDITPRQIDIFIFRYLFARNILNRRGIKFDYDKVCSVMVEYMNSESKIINESNTVSDDVSAILEMVITY